MELGYGLFIHFGSNTFTAAGWGDGKFPAGDFHPAELDTDQWADMAAAAGMKYAVLTTKHHDGFCLWPSRHTDYCTKNSPGRPDIVGRFFESFRKAGIQPGLYYSLWDRNYPRYEDDAAYADYTFAQIEELLTQYGPVVELWFDGGWDKDHPTRQWPYDPAWAADPHAGLTHGERWRWRELYQHIHRLQGECLVVMNSSSDRPGGIKYHPSDIRASEHFNFIWQEKVCEPVLDPVFTDPARGQVFLPLEYCTSLNPNREPDPPRHQERRGGQIRPELTPSYCRKSRLDFGAGNGFFDQAAEFFREVGHGDDGLESNTDFLVIVLSFSECLA